MSQVGNNQNRVGGEYMVQDNDHMSEINKPADQATRKVRQVEQSHSEGRQQGGGNRKSEQRRQAH